MSGDHVLYENVSEYSFEICFEDDNGILHYQIDSSVNPKYNLERITFLEDNIYKVTDVLSPEIMKNEACKYEKLPYIKWVSLTPINIWHTNMVV